MTRTTDTVLKFTALAVAELLRTGARHEIVNGLDHEYGDEPTLMDAHVNGAGELEVTFRHGSALEQPTQTNYKTVEVRTLEEIEPDQPLGGSNV